MNTILQALIAWLAPVLSFTAQEAHDEYQAQLGVPDSDRKSIHLGLFSTFDESFENEALDEQWTALRNFRKVITAALEKERAAKTIGSSLQASVDVYIPNELAPHFEEVDLAELSITSAAKLKVGEPMPEDAFTTAESTEVGVVVSVAEGNKCQRCWRVLPEVGSKSRIDSAHADICIRCEEAL